MLNNKKTVWILLGLFAVVAIGSGIWGYNNYQDKKAYQTYLQNQYQRMFYQVLDEVENIQVNLGKTIITDDPKQNIILLSDVRQLSLSAQEKINQLPISHLALNKTSKFLAQLGDYAFSLSKKNLDGKPSTSEDLKNLEKLHNYTATLTVELQNLFDKMRDGKINPGELRKEGFYAFDEDGTQLDGEFEKIKKKMENYPRLIYDGPFSEHVEEIEPKGLTGEKINLEKAKAIAKGFLDNENISRIRMVSNGKGFIDTYGLEVSLDGRNVPVYIDISRKGGHVVWMLDGRPVGEAEISRNQAFNKAKEFLQQKGYKNMTATYSVRATNSIIFNFVYTQEDVLIYPDMVKVKVALDNGDIIGFDARQYLTSHHDRNIPEPQITEEEAEKYVSMRLDMAESNMAIIPVPGKKESFCYEFKGEYQGDNYIIYINAENGEEEDILQIIEDKKGKYTM